MRMAAVEGGSNFAACLMGRVQRIGNDIVNDNGGVCMLVLVRAIFCQKI